MVFNSVVWLLRTKICQHLRAKRSPLRRAIFALSNMKVGLSSSSFNKMLEATLANHIEATIFLAFYQSWRGALQLENGHLRPFQFKYFTVQCSRPSFEFSLPRFFVSTAIHVKYWKKMTYKHLSKRPLANPIFLLWQRNWNCQQHYVFCENRLTRFQAWQQHPALVVGQHCIWHKAADNASCLSTIVQREIWLLFKNLCIIKPVIHTNQL